MVLKLRIAVIGGGIGGLTAALALGRLGNHVSVYEQAQSLGDIGAGLTLSRGALSALNTLGLKEAVQSMACDSKALAYLHYRTGALLAGDHDHGDGTAEDDTSIACHVHRADLHRILVEAVRKQPGIDLYINHRLTNIELANQRCHAHFANGAHAETDVLIAADGVRSIVRGLLHGQEAPRFTGQVAYRFLMPTDVARPFLSAGRSAIYFGPKRIFNRYTISQNRVLNCVGIAKTDAWQNEGWSTPATVEELLGHFGDWHPDVRGLMERASPDHLIKWALFDRNPLPRWRKGPVTLLGDAAHPMLPFMGLGAAMAIEDAIILARCFESGQDIQVILQQYETARLPRTSHVFRTAQIQGELIQSRDPDSYDATKAPAHDPGFFLYDPVTAEI